MKGLNKMFETFKATLSPMLVMFLCMLIGFVMNKKRFAPENSATVLSKLENYVCVPALLINTFMTRCTIASLKENYTIILYSIAILFFALLIALPLARAFAKDDEYKRSIYSYAMTFGNFGFMGNAIVPAILGSVDPDILYKYLLFTLPLQTAVNTWGIVILIPRGEEKINPLKNLCNPVFFSIILGIILGLTNAGEILPLFVTDTIDYFKNCMGPLAMFLTGFVVASYPIKGLLSDKKIYLAALLRLIVIPAVLLSILFILRAPSLVITLAFFAYATPLGMNTVVFPAAYGGETRTGASMAMISHILCVITIPILFSILNVIL